VPFSRVLVVTIATGSLFVAAGCGGNNKHAVPGLPLWQRVLQSGELDDFDAQMQPPADLNLAQFITQAKPAFIRITAASARKELTADGFKRATIATYSGGQKSGPTVASTVIWVGSAAQAQRVVDWAAQDSLSSCPNICNATIEEFKVKGIPNAKGSHRFRGKNAAGAGAKNPFESYDIVYADGPFVYDLFVLGPKVGAVKQNDLIDAAKAQDKRVKGAPLPRSLTTRRGP
jgi:hypothetical protein